MHGLMRQELPVYPDTAVFDSRFSMLLASVHDTTLEFIDE